MQNIEAMLRQAQAEMDAMGAETYLNRAYSENPTPEFTRLNEEWALGIFAERYNKRHSPKLFFVCHNPPHSNKADFSVYGEDRPFLCDIEITILWPTPTVKSPKGYEDFNPYSPDPVFGSPFLDVSRPPKVPAYARLEQILKKHLRDKYRPYWLVIRDNNHVKRPNLAQLADLTRTILEAEAKRGKLPANLQQVWVFDENEPEPKQVVLP